MTQWENQSKKKRNLYMKWLSIKQEDFRTFKEKKKNSKTKELELQTKMQKQTHILEEEIVPNRENLTEIIDCN